ncbi:uncharacterized protein DSM5745_09132 [Aspergillus mulundensis]|uniref:BHLH domain-containing protein n=1 Tax=Aspergillus mulundensis TaxID=1810919 RepID=A0A3D8QZP1_9EURO|nr:Uncharacterized protein DSM5745_09132 [Aspergillus mulundensis]RDW67266.1 Uncharacterized protein DSM5745_09132 [Aspergillus mulundensis]
MSPDPLSANWSYDSAIDLFSLNTMVPESFPMDIPNDMLWDAKDLPADFFAAPADINGFTVSHDESLSSDQESDDQAFSPTNFMASTPPSASTLDLPSPMAMAMNTNMNMPIKLEPQSQHTVNPIHTQPKRKASMISTSSSQSRYSSSPDLPPQDPSPQPQPTRKSRSSNSNANANGDESTARGRNAAKRAAHNIIEKRYRTNMNAKFVALEKAMAVKTSGVSKSVSASNSSHGVKSSASLKKSEILSNAIAYMQELQEVNERLRKELSAVNRERRAAAYC